MMSYCKRGNDCVTNLRAYGKDTQQPASAMDRLLFDVSTRRRFYNFGLILPVYPHRMENRQSTSLDYRFNVRWQNKSNTNI